MKEPFDQVGEAGFGAIATAFYRRVATDDLVGSFYRKDCMKFAEGRLRDYLIYRFGGSDKYLAEGLGHDYLGLLHSWMRITPTVRKRWLELMFAAMDEVGVTGQARQRLEEFFEHTSNAMVNTLDTKDAPRPKPFSRRPFEAIEDSEL